MSTSGRELPIRLTTPMCDRVALHQGTFGQVPSFVVRGKLLFERPDLSQIRTSAGQMLCRHCSTNRRGGRYG